MFNRFENFWAKMDSARPTMSVPRQIIDLAVHKLLLNTDPRDYYQYKFYEGNQSWDEKSRYMSESGSRYFPWELNPLKYNVLFTDKFVQKTILSGMGIPTPPLLTTVGVNKAISQREQLKAFMDRAPDDIVFKLISGASGTGFTRINKEDGRLSDGENTVTVEQLWDRFTPNLKKGYIVETAVRSAEVLHQLNPSSLNTFRVLTFRLSENDWIPVVCYLKVGRAGARVDNRSAGGLVIRIDEQGYTGIAMDSRDNNREYSVHPDTNVPLEGVLIESLQSVIDLAVTTSKKLPFMGYLGMDIALTDAGPVIIEINAKSGIRYIQNLYGPCVSQEMAAVLKKHTMFSRWDKTHMYPRYYLKRKRRVLW